MEKVQWNSIIKKQNKLKTIEKWENHSQGQGESARFHSCEARDKEKSEYERSTADNKKYPYGLTEART